MKQVFSSTETALLASRLDKRLIIAALLLSLIALAFWMGSRYPALDEKAALGGDNVIVGIAFDQVVSTSSSDTLLQNIVANALNWAYTNKQGMTFGVLFAASILTLMQLFRRKQFNGSLANTLLGVSMGAPLGVCVNCAVPIAMGTHRAGARTETTLAMMFSSPTLNVIVMGMAVALFPFWLAALKIGATMLFIVVAVPLSVRWFGPTAEPDSDALSELAESANLEGLQSDPAEVQQTTIEARSWLSACIWVVREMLRNLWFIVRTTLPFMALAGLLGAAVVTLVPWEMLASTLPQSEPAKFVLLIGVALLGTFLPVPIAFDVVICSVLLAAGVEARYVATLLVTLGLFSIYPALQIAHSIARRLAIALFAMVTMLGVAVGFVGDGLAEWEANRQSQALEHGLMAAPQGPAESSHSVSGMMVGKVLELLAPHRVSLGEKIISADSQIEIHASPLQVNNSKDERLFSAFYGDAVGIDEPDNISALRFMLPLIENRSIASGDIHGDGWPDLLLTSEAGLTLYANIGGTEFVRQELFVDELKDAYIIRAALVDLDGDADLDIVVGTFKQGVFFIANNGGKFDAGATSLPGYKKGAVPGVFAFGDIDRDGNLDAIVGNRAIGNSPLDRTVSAAQNYYLMREGDILVPYPLPGPEGETLSILLSDLNSDGWLDVYVGNDFAPPDHLLLSDGKGSLSPIARGQLMGDTARFTMSIASADINGDLVPEIYVGNISGRRGGQLRDFDKECRFETGDQRRVCLDRLKQLAAFYPARQRSDAVACESISDKALKEGCLIIALTSPALRTGATGHKAVGDLCERIPSQWQDFRLMCEARRAETLTPLSDKEINGTLASSAKQRNILFSRKTGGASYTDLAANMGLDNGGWTYNARFADIDLDGRQDLYVVNGATIDHKRYDHHLFMNRGDHFEDTAIEAGIASGLAATSYTYFDFDRDGDLDIVTVPMIGPVRFFVNNAAGRNNHSIELELRDESGNTYAIGAVVTIHYGPDGSLAQMREIQLSGGFASYDEPLVHFGLGKYEHIDSLTIRWPDGEETLIPVEFSSNTSYSIRRLSKR